MAEYSSLETLNKLQKKAVKHILKMKKGEFYLNGPAGTGKSYTACVAIDLLMKQKNTKDYILILCPTHVAKLQFTQRLKTEWIDSERPPVVLMTVAAFLGQGPQADKITGEDYFPKGAFQGIKGIQIIFTDEVSMVGEYELQEIHKASKKIPVIYLGDAQQLKPVMRKHAYLLLNKMPQITLTEQMRNSGPVLSLCHDLRHRVIFPQKSEKFIDDQGNKSQIIVYDTRHDMIESFLTHLKTASNPSDITYLAYTNSAVEHIKRLAHHALYGDAIFCVGEYVRLGRHLLWKRKPLGHRGHILKILKILDVKTKTITRGFTCPVYRLYVENIDMKITGEIECVSAEDQVKFLDILQELYKECAHLFATKQMDDYDVTRAEVDSLKKLAHLKSPYSQTIHSAQGRSIPHVYVDTYNIAERGNDKRRLLYVACSRTQYDLHLIRITDRLKLEMMKRRQERRAARKAGDLTKERHLW